jgi:uncharacterized iron-regulated membrane protein
MISFSEKPIDIRNFSVDESGIVIAAKEGVFTSVSGKELEPEILPIKKKQKEKIDLQKLITDIHTGEFFGQFFYIFMDLTAVGMVAMSITGLYIWYRPRKKKAGRKPCTPTP